MHKSLFKSFGKNQSKLSYLPLKPISGAVLAVELGLFTIPVCCLNKEHCCVTGKTLIQLAFIQRGYTFRIFPTQQEWSM